MKRVKILGGLHSYISKIRKSSIIPAISRTSCSKSVTDRDRFAKYYIDKEKLFDKHVMT